MIKNAPILFLEPIDEGAADEDAIIRKLRAYGPYALIELARTTRNPSFLDVLGGYKLYKALTLPLAPDDYTIYMIKKECINNPCTSPELLRRVASRQLFFDRLLESHPDKLKDIVNHPGATADLLDHLAELLSIAKYWAPYHLVGDGIATIITCPLAGDILIIRFLNSPLPAVRIALARSVVSDIMIGDSSTEVLAEVAGNIHTSLFILKTLCRPERDNRIRSALAVNPMIDAEIIDTLITTGDLDIKRRLAGNLANNHLPMIASMPEMITAWLVRLLAVNDSAMAAIIAQGKNHLQPTVLSRLLVYGEQIQKTVATREDLDGKIVSDLLTVGSVAIDCRLLENGSVDLSVAVYTEILRRSLTAKDGWRVRLALAAKERLPDSILWRLAGDSNIRVREQIAKRSDISRKIIEMLAADPYPFVRGAIAGNPCVPPELLLRFQDDSGSLIEGLIDETGDLAEGVTTTIIDILRRRSSLKTVLGRLATNEQVLRLPVLTALLVRNYRFRESIFERIRDLHDRALKAYQNEDYPTALDLITPIADCGYAPFGALFIAGNCCYRTGNILAAEQYYRYSISSRNNIMSFLALDFLKKGQPVSDVLLTTPEAVQTILQNLHLAGPVSSQDVAACIKFIDFMQQPPAAKSSRTGTEDAPCWSSLLNDTFTEIFVALQVYGLCHVLRQKRITLPDALAVLKALLITGPDPQMTAAKWEERRRAFWRAIIQHSTLAPAMKRELVSGNPDTGEFFLRGGIWGMVKSREFPGFRDQLIMDNVPLVLREDLVRSIWIEWMDLTGNVLFDEPLFCRRAFFVREHGTFGGVDQTLRINLSLRGGDSHFGTGDIHSAVRSEGAHSITSGLFRNLGIFRPVDELQDRSAMVRFPAELKNQRTACRVVDTYARHDRLMRTLYRTAVRYYSPDEMTGWLADMRGKGAEMDAVICNATFVLKNRENTPLAQRMAGEALFLFFRHRPGSAGIDPNLLDGVEKLRKLKAEIRQFSWDTRVFFDGGAYLVMYDQPFPLRLPPIDPIFDTIGIDKVHSRYNDEHFCGEWLHYLFRMRIRELLTEGILPVGLLEVFYPTAAIYLSAVTRLSELSRQLDAGMNACLSGNIGDAVSKLLLQTAPAQLAGLTVDMQNDLIALKKNIAGAIRIDTGKLASFLAPAYINRQVTFPEINNATVCGYASSINAHLDQENKIEAATVAVRLIYFLRENGYHRFADELKGIFLPTGGQTNDIVAEIRRFKGRHRHSFLNIATSLAEIVNIIRKMTPGSVLDSIRNRLVAGADPEKIIFNKAIDLMENILTEDDRLTFSRFLKILINFYNRTYRFVKTRKIDVPVSEYTPCCDTYWKNLYLYIFSSLGWYKFLDLSSLKTVFARLRDESLKLR